MLKYYERKNEAIVSGTIVKRPKLISVRGKGSFYCTALHVERLSGTIDTVPVEIPKRILEESGLWLSEGMKVYIEGCMSSNDARGDDGKSHLKVYVLAQKISKMECVDDRDINEIVMQACLTKNPNYRLTPLKKEITDLLVAGYSPAANKSCYIPCVAWGENARACSEMQTGDEIFFSGRFQSRDYLKILPDGEKLQKTTYEISISQIF